MKLAEIINLISRFPKNPSGVLDEIKVRWELLIEHSTVASPSYEAGNFEEMLFGIEKCLQMNIQKFLHESALNEIEEKILLGQKKISESEIPFPLIHNGDPKLGRLCYIICRALKPSVVVETGVAYGVSSSYILQALQVNQKGKLFSIDKPPEMPQAKNFIGALIPGNLRENWQLYQGESQKLLPALLSEIKEIDIFLHDSRHTYKNMTSEFKMVEPYLADRSILIADDINRNIAFEEFIERTQPDFWAVSAEESKESLFGAGIFLEKVILS